MFRCDLFNAGSINEIKASLSLTLSEKYIDLSPSDQNARILIKPNLNSNMNALTGNTTDLRLVAAIIEFLKKQGYKNITIGEGTNSGFYRNRISVISRLMIDKLASYYGITVKDLNYSEPVHIDFENGVKALTLAGKTDLRILASLLERFNLFICNDTAPLHIASAMNTPTVAIFGPSKSNETGPYGNINRVVEKDFPCRYTCDEDVCNHTVHNECMKTITPDNVYEAANYILKQELQSKKIICFET